MKYGVKYEGYGKYSVWEFFGIYLI